MHCEREHAGKRVTHAHSHLHDMLVICVTHPRTRTPSQCIHMHTHPSPIFTPLHVCNRAERSLIPETQTFLSHGRGLCRWTRQNHTTLLSPTSRHFCTRTGNTAPTVRQSYLLAHPPVLCHSLLLITSPSHRLSLSPSIHSSLFPPAVKWHEFLKDTALRSAVV